MSEKNQSPLSILRLPEVVERTGLSRSQIYALAAKGSFPSPVKLGSVRASGWTNISVEDWIKRQVAESQTVSKERRSA